MVTRERMASETARIARPRTVEPTRPEEWRAEPSPSPDAQPSGPGLVSRLFWVSVGLGLAVTGFALVLSVFLAFIGLPMFVFGLALMQSQAR